jgi:prepilin-type N-terminal cleavage/methylation domain-containing protein
MSAAGKTSRSAFTLIELLVVIAILSLLIAMLSPYLTRAREIARRAVCMQNQKSLAMGIHGFAAGHGNRCPGGGYQDQGNEQGIGWDCVLDVEWYRARPTVQSYVGNLHPLNKNCLTCPSFRYWPGMGASGVYQYSRAASAEGSPVCTPNADGLAVDPKYVNFRWREYWGQSFGFRNYFLGMLVEKWARPYTQFLVIETEYQNDNTFQYPVPSGGHPIVNTGMPAWCSTQGRNMGFRHCLPPDPTLYQTQATAIFSYMDGHVAIVYPNMNLLDLEHFLPNGSNSFPN